jgi:hypothetical protein
VDDASNEGEVVATGAAEVTVGGTVPVEPFEVAENPQPEWAKPGSPPENAPETSDRRRRQPAVEDTEEPDAPIEAPPMGVPNRRAR